MKRITYIITHRESTKDRRSNLYCVLDWLNHVEEIEKVILVEQDFEPRNTNIVNQGLNKNYELEYKFIHNPARTFNKCWAFNVGAKMANTEWLAFGDNDVIMDTGIINDAIKISLDNYESFTPYETVYDLSPKETQLIKDTKDYTDIHHQTKTVRGGAPYGGGIFFIRRKSFFDTGAWHEEFINWGAEDEDISLRIFKNLKYLSRNKEAVHLHHTRNLESTHQNRFYKLNLGILANRRNKPLIELMKDFDIDKIGLEDKYSNQ